MTDERPDALSVRCPWCHAAPFERCVVPRRGGKSTDLNAGPHAARVKAANRESTTPTENRPTMTPPPNRPDTEL